MVATLLSPVLPYCEGQLLAVHVLMAQSRWGHTTLTWRKNGEDRTHALFRNKVLSFCKESCDKGGLNMGNIEKHGDFEKQVMIMIIIMI